jgi:hypothetical protein
MLVSDDDIYAYLDEEPDDDPNGVLLTIRDAVEELLATETSCVFGDEAILVDEVYDGSGSSLLYTKRPIKVLTGIKFLYGSEILAEQYFSLPITDYVTWQVGKRRIHSRAYKFPCGYNNVLVSYTASENKPKIAVQAVKEVTASVFRTIGSEDARSEQMGTFQHVLKRKIEENLFWSQAVGALMIPSLG